MRYDMTQPCDSCPFLKDSPNAVRLTRGRIREIAGMMLSDQGGTFACHKTIDYDDDGETSRRGPKEQHCAGALIFMLKANPRWTQMARIVSRIGAWNPDKMIVDERVFDSLRDMLKTAIGR